MSLLDFSYFCTDAEKLFSLIFLVNPGIIILIKKKLKRNIIAIVPMGRVKRKVAGHMFV